MCLLHNQYYSCGPLCSYCTCTATLGLVNHNNYYCTCSHRADIVVKTEEEVCSSSELDDDSSENISDCPCERYNAMAEFFGNLSLLFPCGLIVMAVGDVNVIPCTLLSDTFQLGFVFWIHVHVLPTYIYR